MSNYQKTLSDRLQQLREVNTKVKQKFDTNTTNNATNNNNSNIKQSNQTQTKISKDAIIDSIVNSSNKKDTPSRKSPLSTTASTTTTTKKYSPNLGRVSTPSPVSFPSSSSSIGRNDPKETLFLSQGEDSKYKDVKEEIGDSESDYELSEQSSRFLPDYDELDEPMNNLMSNNMMNNAIPTSARASPIANLFNHQKESIVQPVSTKPSVSVSEVNPLTSSTQTNPFASTSTTTFPQPSSQLLYKRLQSTVQLLHESLEEQGNLHALIEYTKDQQPGQTIDTILQMEFLHLTQWLGQLPSSIPQEEWIQQVEDLAKASALTLQSLCMIPSSSLKTITNNTSKTSSNNTNNSSITSLIHILLLKLHSQSMNEEQLLQQCIDLRMKYEEQKQNKQQIERELDVTKELLHTANEEIDHLQTELQDIQDKLDHLFHPEGNLDTFDHQINLNQSQNSLASSMNRSKINQIPKHPNTKKDNHFHPPLPEDFDEEEIDVLEDFDQELDQDLDDENMDIEMEDYEEKEPHVKVNTSFKALPPHARPWTRFLGTPDEDQEDNQEEEDINQLEEAEIDEILDDFDVDIAISGLGDDFYQLSSPERRARIFALTEPNELVAKMKTPPLPLPERNEEEDSEEEHHHNNDDEHSHIDHIDIPLDDDHSESIHSIHQPEKKVDYDDIEEGDIDQGQQLSMQDLTPMNNNPNRKEIPPIEIRYEQIYSTPSTNSITKKSPTSARTLQSSISTTSPSSSSKKVNKPPSPTKSQATSTPLDNVNNTNTSTNPSSNVDHTVVLDIDLENGRIDKICINPDSDPMMLAFDFMASNSLPPTYFEPLYEYIKKTQEPLLIYRNQDKPTSPTHSIPINIDDEKDEPNDSENHNLHDDNNYNHHDYYDEHDQEIPIDDTSNNTSHSDEINPFLMRQHSYDDHDPPVHQRRRSTSSDYQPFAMMSPNPILSPKTRRKSYNSSDPSDPDDEFILSKSSELGSSYYHMPEIVVKRKDSGYYLGEDEDEYFEGLEVEAGNTSIKTMGNNLSNKLTTTIQEGNEDEEEDEEEDIPLPEDDESDTLIDEVDIALDDPQAIDINQPMPTNNSIPKDNIERSPRFVGKSTARHQSNISLDDDAILTPLLQHMIDTFSPKKKSNQMMKTTFQPPQQTQQLSMNSSPASTNSSSNQPLVQSSRSRDAALVNLLRQTPSQDYQNQNQSKEVIQSLENQEDEQDSDCYDPEEDDSHESQDSREYVHVISSPSISFSSPPPPQLSFFSFDQVVKPSKQAPQANFFPPPPPPLPSVRSQSPISTTNKTRHSSIVVNKSQSYNESPSQTKVAPTIGRRSSTSSSSALGSPQLQRPATRASISSFPTQGSTSNSNTSRTTPTNNKTTPISSSSSQPSKSSIVPFSTQENDDILRYESDEEIDDQPLKTVKTKEELFSSSEMKNKAKEKPSSEVIPSSKSSNTSNSTPFSPPPPPPPPVKKELFTQQMTNQPIQSSSQPSQPPPPKNSTPPTSSTTTSNPSVTSFLITSTLASPISTDKQTTNLISPPPPPPPARPNPPPANTRRASTSKTNSISNSRTGLQYALL